MKRLGFRSASVSTEEKFRARAKAPQITEPQLFLYCVLAIALFYQALEVLPFSTFHLLFLIS